MSAYPADRNVRRDARLSSDGLYRYALWRDWRAAYETPRWATFIMLNPSTADATQDDPTIRRCVGFALREGCTGMAVVNLYAYRATKPADLWRVSDPVGPDADATLAEFLSLAQRHGGPIIAAWGAHAKPERVREVLTMDGATHLACLGLTKHGAPRHPLYLPADAPLVPLLDGSDR